MESTVKLADKDVIKEESDSAAEISEDIVDMDFHRLKRKLRKLLGGKTAKKRQPPIERQRVIIETKYHDERQYRYDFQQYFSVDKIDSTGRSVMNVTSRMMKILSEREDINDDQRKAMEEFCGNRRALKSSYKCHAFL